MCGCFSRKIIKKRGNIAGREAKVALAVHVHDLYAACAVLPDAKSMCAGRIRL